MYTLELRFKIDGDHHQLFNVLNEEQTFSYPLIIKRGLVLKLMLSLLFGKRVTVTASALKQD
jgi:hypothetical protein